MGRPTLQALWEALDTWSPNMHNQDEADPDDPPGVKKARKWLTKNKDKWKLVFRDQYYSECHPGGDDVVSIVDSAIEAEREGFKVETYYGDDTEVMIIGFKEK